MRAVQTASSPVMGITVVVIIQKKRSHGGQVIRLRILSNVAGASSYPGAGNLPISVRGAVATPGSRWYQVWYRNAAAFCTPATFNLSNAVRIDWSA